MALKEQKTDMNKWFKYQWIIRNLPFFVYLSLLALLYIANGHYADNTVREINLTKKLLKEQEYEYKMLNGKLMFQNRQTEIAKSVASIGLKETVDQPIFLKDSTVQK
jgi:hypothetical protein